MKACINIDVEVFVVDNNSTDGSKEFFTNKFPSVKFIWNKENIGFAKANNAALQYCSGQYILFLNPDTILSEDCLEKTIAFLKAQQNPGACGIRMIDGSGNFLPESKRAFPSPLTSLFKLTGLTYLFPRSKTFARYYLGNLDEHKNYEVDVLAGAFMLIPKKVLDITGSFDEAFFMYGEDIDLGYRIQKAGFKNYYFAESSIIHFKGESTKKGNIKYTRMFYKAMSIFVKKHYSSGSAGLFNALMQTAIWFRATLSGIENIFKNIFYSTKKIKQHKLIIASGEEEYNSLVTLLQKATVEMKVVGRINSQSLKNTANAAILIEMIKQKNADEILFCEGEISFKEIISAIQHLRLPVSYKFYSAGSHSIIGSDSKDNSGDCISFN